MALHLRQSTCLVLIIFCVIIYADEAGDAVSSSGETSFDLVSHFLSHGCIPIHLYLASLVFSSLGMDDMEDTVTNSKIQI